jgi:hypothetical protein
MDSRYLGYSCGQFVSDDDCETIEELMQVLRDGDPEGRVTFWEPFEGSAPEYIADLIESAARSLERVFIPREDKEQT